jgi:23S rRNA pseudouridine2605 synthase
MQADRRVGGRRHDRPVARIDQDCANRRFAGGGRALGLRQRDAHHGFIVEVWHKALVTDSSTSRGERIAKVLARAGVCSRRDGERLIADGRVSVNGKTLASPALNVTPDDDIRVDGRPIAEAEPTRLWRYHKPVGLVTTHRDPEGRPNVFDHLPDTLPRVISVGRLDLTSEGLLLLTNDGELARRLELPATGWLRRYRVRAYGRVTQEELDALADGVEVEGVRYGPINAQLERMQGSNAWIAVSLNEGKNREVRKVLAALGLKVNRLIRIAYGPFQLGALASGAVEEVPRRVLAAQLGEAPPPGQAKRKAKTKAKKRR